MPLFWSAFFRQRLSNSAHKGLCTVMKDSMSIYSLCSISYLKFPNCNFYTICLFFELHPLISICLSVCICICEIQCLSFCYECVIIRIFGCKSREANKVVQGIVFYTNTIKTSGATDGLKNSHIQSFNNAPGT